METTIWSATLAEFRDQVGGAEPVPAGVAISAVAASLALALLSKVLRITGGRKGFEGDPQEIETLGEAARRASTELTHKADEDVRAFNRYLECMREPENPGREQAMTAAMEEATRVPLDAARLTIGGLGLCSHSAGLCEQGMTASDLAMARSVLSGAARAMLLSVESNLQHLRSDEPFHNEISAELQELKNRLGR
jgi:formiminotetrahydrofolate cyclodeaminase